MKRILIALGVVMFTIPALADDNVDFVFGVERKAQAETNAMYLDTTFNMLGFKSTTGINYKVDDDLNSTFNGFEFDLKKPLFEDGGVNLYINNDFDVNLKHQESTVGLKFKF